jgi:hypothetical protein
VEFHFWLTLEHEERVFKRAFTVLASSFPEAVRRSLRLVHRDHPQTIFRGLTYSHPPFPDLQ